MKPWLWSLGLVLLRLVAGDEMLCLDYRDPTITDALDVMCVFMPKTFTTETRTLLARTMNLVGQLGPAAGLQALRRNVWVQFKAPTRVPFMMSEMSLADITAITLTFPNVLTYTVVVYPMADFIVLAECLMRGIRQLTTEAVLACHDSTRISRSFGPSVKPDASRTLQSTANEMRDFFDVTLGDTPSKLGIPGEEWTTMIYKRVPGKDVAQQFMTYEEAEVIRDSMRSVADYFERFCAPCLVPLQQRVNGVGGIVTVHDYCVCCSDPDSRPFKEVIVAQNELRPPPPMTSRELDDTQSVNSDLNTNNVALIAWPTELTNMLTSDEIFDLFRDVFGGSSADVLEQRHDLNMRAFPWSEDKSVSLGGTSSGGWSPTADLKLRRMYFWAKLAKEACIEAAMSLRGWSAIQKLKYAANVHASVELVNYPTVRSAARRAIYRTSPMFLRDTFCALEFTMFDQNSAVFLRPPVPGRRDQVVSRFLSVSDNFYVIKNADWFNPAFEGDTVQQRPEGVDASTLRGVYGDDQSLTNGALRLSVLVWFSGETDETAAQSDHLFLDSLMW